MQCAITWRLEEIPQTIKKDAADVLARITGLLFGL